MPPYTLETVIGTEAHRSGKTHAGNARLNKEGHDGQGHQFAYVKVLLSESFKKEYKKNTAYVLCCKSKGKAKGTALASTADFMQKAKLIRTYM